MFRPIRLAWVEGHLDGAAAERLLSVLDCASPELTVVTALGAERFWANVERYNQASRNCGPILGLVDLEKAKCPSLLISQYLPKRDPGCVLRIAVPILEAWMMADRDNLARFLGIKSKSKIPICPEDEIHPKQTLVNLARQSSLRAIREDVVPQAGSLGIVGKWYFPAMKSFVSDHWDPLAASENSPSLYRAIQAIRGICQIG